MKVIHTSGSRKSAVARATLNEGKGRVRINKILLDNFEPRMSRLKLMEPLLLAGADASKININVNVKGGGPVSQAEAARLAIARALAQYNKKLEDVFSTYDRHLMTADNRRKETRKPNCCGKARSKRQKSYR